MFDFLKGLFGKRDFAPFVANVNALEQEVEKYSDEELKLKSAELKTRLANGESEDLIVPMAFALVREASRRTLKQRHFDVQLIGGLVLHEGNIAEMLTGEGKTLAATAPAYTNALYGKGVHVVTVNEYLAKRDTVWMGQIYYALGVSVACLAHESAYLYDPSWRVEKEDATNIDTERDIKGSFLVQQDFLRPISRKEAYAADITYGTNHEFGFDYLRDNLAYRVDDQVQRGHYYAIIDEVDSILIDEARTPLIISAPDQESSEQYKIFARAVAGLEEGVDYVIDEKLRSADITERGINKIEQVLNIKNIFDAENLRLTHYLQESLKARALFKKDRDYVVKDGAVFIVDQFTGRVLQGRRYSAGLHQAIEAKEGVQIQQESRTYAQISIQNYFRLYKKIAGMTGTAQTSAEEFHKVYGLEVVNIPPHRKVARVDMPDAVYKTLDAKYRAIAQDVKERHAKGQPVLIGTVSIQKSEEISRYLSREGIQHEILNAKNNEREGAIIAQAGRLGAVTVATNMAGRGVDIILGGNPPTQEDAERVRSLGGLHVIGTERHEARRIDNQLRGRSGRQGDPGSSQFYLSLEDDLMRIFGGDRIKNLMTAMKVPEDMPIESRMVSRGINQAQSKVEGFHFDARKHLLEYDDVLNKQRVAVYKKRQDIVSGTEPKQLLGLLDSLWMDHLEGMEALAESVRLRAYGQHDPLVEYRKEGHIMFQAMLQHFEKTAEELKKKIAEGGVQTGQNPVRMPMKKISIPVGPAGEKIGRNDPCHCGSGKKFKKCHGK